MGKFDIRKHRKLVDFLGKLDGTDKTHSFVSFWKINLVRKLTCPPFIEIIALVWKSSDALNTNSLHHHMW